MSPENSETESEQEGDECNSDDEVESTKSRRIVKRPLSWRSRSFNDHLDSLDRKWDRRSTARSKAMSKIRQIGGMLQCEPPEGLPNWMKRQ